MPNILKPLYKAWMKFAHVLGTVNMYILLTVFFIILAPFGIVLRIGRMMDNPAKKQSMWHVKTPEASVMESLHRTF